MTRQGLCCCWWVSQQRHLAFQIKDSNCAPLSSEKEVTTVCQKLSSQRLLCVFTCLCASFTVWNSQRSLKTEKVTAYVSRYDGYISYIESLDQYPPWKRIIWLLVASRMLPGKYKFRGATSSLTNNDIAFISQLAHQKPSIKEIKELHRSTILPVPSGSCTQYLSTWITYTTF